MKPKRVATTRSATVYSLRGAKRARQDSGDRCAKCDSTYVVREPAFLHCRLCGSLARLAKGSLLAQEEFELRSGLRLAS